MEIHTGILIKYKKNGWWYIALQVTYQLNKVRKGMDSHENV